MQKHFTKLAGRLAAACLSLAGLQAVAQPTITAQHVYGFNTPYIYSVFDSVGAPINLSRGGNKVWDFSGRAHYNPTSPDFDGFDTLVFKPAAGTPYDTAYPGATHAVEFSYQLPGDGAMGWQYHSANGGWGSLGFAFDFTMPQPPAVLNISGRARYAGALGLPSYTFPLNYQDSTNYSTTFGNDQNVLVLVNKFVVGEQRQRVRSLATATVTVPAWGQLKLPNETQPSSALLVKRLVIAVDTSYDYANGQYTLTPSTAQDPNPRRDTACTYEWVRANGNFISAVALWDMQVDTAFSFQFIYTPGSTTANSPTAAKASHKAFPNPVASGNSLHIELAGMGQRRADQVRITSVDGRSTVVNLTHPVGNETLTLQMQGYAPGTYFYEVLGKGEKLASGKLLVQP